MGDTRSTPRALSQRKPITSRGARPQGRAETSMNEQHQQELLATMQALLAKAGAASAPAATGWNQPMATGPATVQGVGVPAKISRGRGTMKITLWLPAECARSPAALNDALDQLEAAGIPLDVWEPKDSGWNSASRSWRR